MKVNDPVWFEPIDKAVAVFQNAISTANIFDVSVTWKTADLTSNKQKKPVTTYINSNGVKLKTIDMIAPKVIDTVTFKKTLMTANKFHKHVRFTCQMI